MLLKMKNMNQNRGRGFEDDNSPKGSVGKNKSSKKRLSIYEDFEDDDDDYIVHEKFKKKHK